MRVNFQLTEEDLIATVRYCQRKSPTRWQNTGFMAILLLLMLVGLNVSVMRMDLPASEKAVLAVVQTMLWMLIYVPIVMITRWLMRRSIRVMCAAKSNRARMSPQTLNVYDYGIEVKSAFQTTEIAWKSFLRVDQDKDYVFFFLGPADCIPLPKRFFPNPPAAEEFFAEVCRHVQMARDSDQNRGEAFNTNPGAVTRSAPNRVAAERGSLAPPSGLPAVTPEREGGQRFPAAPIASPEGYGSPAPPRLFWRSVLALAVGCIWPFMFLVFAAVLIATSPGGGAGINLPLAVTGIGLIVFPSILATLVAFRLLTKKYLLLSARGETRCRKCGYILKGLTEPRCSECGERI